MVFIVVCEILMWKVSDVCDLLLLYLVLPSVVLPPSAGVSADYVLLVWASAGTDAHKNRHRLSAMLGKMKSGRQVALFTRKNILKEKITEVCFTFYDTQKWGRGTFTPPKVRDCLSQSRLWFAISGSAWSPTELFLQLHKLLQSTPWKKLCLALFIILK